MFKLRGILLTTFSLLTTCCATINNLRLIRSAEIAPEMDALSQLAPDVSLDFVGPQMDSTPVVVGDDGAKLFLMKAGLDYDGSMVATDELVPAIVRSRFSNVAERGGMVSLYFSITIPDAMLDGRWRVSLFPRLCYGPDTVALKPIVVIGNEFESLQAKGYQQYEHYLASLVTDSLKFIRGGDLETFSARNSMKNSFNIEESEVLDHYTDHLWKDYDHYRRSRLDAVFRKYVKSPLVESYSEFQYDGTGTSFEDGIAYEVSLEALPGVKKAVVSIGGLVEKWGEALCEIPQTDGFTFFISSLSALAEEEGVSDPLQRQGLEALKNLDYSRACEILSDFHDINLSLSLIALGRAREALLELENLPESAKQKYLKAIVYSLMGEDYIATDLYGQACRQDRTYISRGNIDPEILKLINNYNLL